MKKYERRVRLEAFLADERAAGAKLMMVSARVTAVKHPDGQVYYYSESFWTGPVASIDPSFEFQLRWSSGGICEDALDVEVAEDLSRVFNHAGRMLRQMELDQ